VSFQFADINGVRIHYDVQGEGPALVLIHAAIANLNMWEAQMGPFAEHVRVIRYDVRGFGETPDPAGKYTDYEDLKALLDFLEVEKAHILGISNGGRIALDFAVTYPQMVDKLVLVAPGVPGYKVDFDWDTAERGDEFNAAKETGDLEQQAEIWTQVWVDGPDRQPKDLDPDFRRRAKALARHTIELGIGEGEGDIARPPAGERLDTLTMPALVMLGEEDLGGMHLIVDRLEGNLPNVRRVNMANTAHLPPMEKPDEFNRFVLDFLQG
jgi:pimeloyl-ACP methyl ester carboxylesterase